jgi:hypothetical protein
MAYGAIAAPLQLAELPTLSFPLPGGWELSTHPIKGAEAPKSVLEYLYSVFSKELQGVYEVMRRSSLFISHSSSRRIGAAELSYHLPSTII